MEDADATWAESPRKMHGAGCVKLQAVAVNGTCLAALKDFVLTTSAHVIMAQELHTKGETTLVAVQWFKKHGWRALINDAEEGATAEASKGGGASW